MLTPQEVNEKVFPKASFGGYNMAAVDEFLDALTEDYTALYKENAVLKSKMKVLAEKVEEYRETEDAMRSTLLTAQKMATTLVNEAEEKKKQILAETAIEASRRTAHLDEQTRDAEKRLAMAQSSLSAFLHRSVELCEGQTAFLKGLPEMELAQEVPPTAPTAPATEEAMDVDQIEQHILENYASVPAAEERPADEHDTQTFPRAQEPAQEENPFPSDFKLNLGELKFGRNYNGDDQQ